MQPNISLSLPGVYVPSNKDLRNVLTNQDLEKMVETSDEWITTRSGIKQRRIEHYLGVHEMGLKAAKMALKRNNLRGDQIDEVIFCTNKHYLSQEFPCHAGYIAKEIGAKDGIPIHDEAAGCSGGIYGLRTGKNNLIAEPDKKNILVVIPEKLSSFTSYKNRNMCVLFGDAAGAYIVQRGTNGRIINIIAHGRANDRGVLSLVYGKGHKLTPSDDLKEKFKLVAEEDNYIEMDGGAVMKFASKVMAEAVHEIVEKSGYTLRDIDAIIPHQANIRIINFAERLLRRKKFEGKLIVNLQDYGNTSAASTIIAHNEALEKKLIEPGDKVVKVVFGAGLTWASMLFEQCDFDYDKVFKKVA